jgi:hypothetical protein
VLSELFEFWWQVFTLRIVPLSELKATTTISYSDLSTLLIRVPDSTYQLIKIIDYFYGYWHAQQVLLS